ncbi:hypothetical protein J4Q44_G00141160 [Coregonus suidteri]|uniref:Uncharacterized protein n=1 Tax=Coregonus suidteri TaxID=861788 RepID=A0AAN8R5V7_9TELE
MACHPCSPLLSEIRGSRPNISCILDHFTQGQSTYKRLEEEKVHAASFAKAEAQASVKDEVGRILELERVTTHNTLTQAVMRERVSAEDEKLRAQLYVSP